MNAKLILFSSCFGAVALVASVATAGPRGRGGGMGRGGGPHFSSMPTRSAPTFRSGGSRGSRTFTRSGSQTYRNWSGGNWSGSGDWRHHRHHRFSNDSFIFLGGFGFPYYGYYPYGYYGYDYYPDDYYGYDSYDEPAYGYGYGTESRVLEVQRRLARAGYYRGPIDGIMGPQTRRAIRAYERDHNAPDYGVIDRQLAATAGLS